MTSTRPRSVPHGYRIYGMAPKTIGMAKLRTGGLIGGVSGRVGNVLFVRMPDGREILRELPIGRDPRTPSQCAWRDLVRRAGALWRSLSYEQAEAWNAYAADQATDARLAGGGSAPNGAGAFIGLTARFWRYHGLIDPPLSPPERAFLGDAVAVTATGGAGVTFAADRPNAAGVATELLLQRLDGPNSRPQNGRDRHMAYFEFAGGALSTTVPCTPGAYVASVRYLLEATGQTSALVRVGRAMVVPA